LYILIFMFLGSKRDIRMLKVINTEDAKLWVYAWRLSSNDSGHL
jgi:hypothetical protein